MVFTGKNLKLVRDAIKRAISDINTELGSHPCPGEYEEEIEELELERSQYEQLLIRVERKL